MPDRGVPRHRLAEVDLDAKEVDIAWHLVRATGAGLQRLPSTKSGERGERLIPLSGWAVTMLKRRRELIGADVEPVFPGLGRRLARPLERPSGVACRPRQGRD
jgi:hypothetical protein